MQEANLRPGRASLQMPNHKKAAVELSMGSALPPAPSQCSLQKGCDYPWWRARNSSGLSLFSPHPYVGRISEGVWGVDRLEIRGTWRGFAAPQPCSLPGFSLSPSPRLPTMSHWGIKGEFNTRRKRCGSLSTGEATLWRAQPKFLWNSRHGDSSLRSTSSANALL